MIVIKRVSLFLLQVVIILQVARMNEANSPVSTASTKLPPSPTILSTWKFGTLCVKEGRALLESGESAIDAVEESIKALELDNQEQYYVGIGGLPNANGKMEFDAAIMDHRCRYGAVLGLQDITTPISVARSVMEKCVHNVLVGEGSLEWALSHGFVRQPEKVLTQESKAEWEAWKTDKSAGKEQEEQDHGHDTVGVICLDKQGRLACGTSTSGWKFKHAGRVGDAPLVGSGLYCDGVAGAAVCTGDGEEIMRSCLAFLVVEQMRAGLSPGEACRVGIERLTRMHPKDQLEGPTMYEKGSLTVAVIAMDTLGRCGAASTLCDANQHRGRPGFPAVVHRTGDAEDFSLHEAGLQGLDF